MTDQSSRVDLLLVADMIERGARVLDVACGSGRHVRAARASQTAPASSLLYSTEPPGCVIS